MHILSPETDNCPSWISGRERMTVENISWSVSNELVEGVRIFKGAKYTFRVGKSVEIFLWFSWKGSTLIWKKKKKKKMLSDGTNVFLFSVDPFSAGAYLSKNQISSYQCCLSLKIMADKKYQAHNRCYLPPHPPTSTLRPTPLSTRYSETSLQRQHLFPKTLPLKWVCCCTEYWMSILICTL